MLKPRCSRLPCRKIAVISLHGCAKSNGPESPIRNSTAPLIPPAVDFVTPTNGKRHTVSLRAEKRLVYNTKNLLGTRKRACPSEVNGVATFEDFGRKLDREIGRLRELAAKKISPATRLKAARSLRRMSDKLSQIAADIEAKVEPKADSH